MYIHQVAIFMRMCVKMYTMQLNIAHNYTLNYVCNMRSIIMCCARIVRLHKNTRFNQSQARLRTPVHLGSYLKFNTCINDWCRSMQLFRFSVTDGPITGIAQDSQ